jgi:hypothetical protein
MRSAVLSSSLVNALGQTAQSQAQTIAQLTAPEPPSPLDFLMTQLAPLAMQLGVHLAERLNLGPSQIPQIGAHERQVQTEFEAEEAKLRSEFNEKRARLLANFGPRFVEARQADELQPAAARPPHVGARNGVAAC